MAYPIRAKTIKAYSCLISSTLHLGHPSSSSREAERRQFQVFNVRQDMAALKKNGFANKLEL